RPNKDDDWRCYKKTVRSYWKTLNITTDHADLCCSAQRKDSGMLSYKEHLPVSQVVVGDLDRPGSEAKVSVGPVRCQGDPKQEKEKCPFNKSSLPTKYCQKHYFELQWIMLRVTKRQSSVQIWVANEPGSGGNEGDLTGVLEELRGDMRFVYSGPPANVNAGMPSALLPAGWVQEYLYSSEENYWNAASFVTSSSYLHFSTFQGETSADISFYFKTSASDGVFLENLGNTDFIKLELKSATEVSFSFDVGNGPVEIVVRSPNPLNDDQWHRVNAERNVKQASLQVDQLPLEIRKAPTEGHTRLELYSQLYVGAAGGQRGFLGCIRSLRMNGVTLDLEERAKVTPGVKPGCSGHCTSYGMYCANGGKCVEKYNGYSCDCSKTAYDGPFCIKDVGAFFEEGMWLRYNFHSPGTSVKDLVSRTPLSSADPEITAPDLSLNKEELSFSFSTTKSPCILLYVSSYTPDFMAVLVNPTGNLQIRYNLGGTKEPYNIDIDHRNMANGQPHTVNVTRNRRDIILQLDHYPPTSYSLPATSDIQFNSPKALFLGKVIEIGKIDQDIYKYNTPGFTGCLSRVQFNQIAPLKAALRPTNTSSHVHIQGELVESNCGASPLTIPPMSAATDPWHLDSASADFPYNGQAIGDGVNRNSAIIGGVIAVVIFTILCTLVFLIRYMFRHKGTYHTNEAKGAESAESADAAIMNNDPNFTETIDETKKEWLI
ncbi:Contactin-associated protein-like 2, partial [Lamprotornis superbus]